MNNTPIIGDSRLLAHSLEPQKSVFSAQRVLLNKQKIEKMEEIDTFNLRINFETGFLEFRDFHNEIKFISKLSKSFYEEKYIIIY